LAVCSLVAEVKVSQITPMFKQYLAAKREHPEVLLLFRLGDFYELFGEDAEVASRVLELTLTAREIGKGNRVAMCGVPHHSIEKYLARLLAAGYRAAICEQTEDPAQAKGLVRREVVRVVTPGTLVEESLLTQERSNYLISVYPSAEGVGLALVEVSTGEFRAAEFKGARGAQEALAEIGRLQPAECVLPSEAADLEGWRARLREATGGLVSTLESQRFLGEGAGERLKQQFGLATLDGLGVGEMPLAVEAAANAVRYLATTHPQALSNLRHLHAYSTSEFMVLDRATIRNLELFANLRDGGRQNTLLEVLDHTLTPMGARLLRSWLAHPLKERGPIEERLEAVESLVRGGGQREQLRGILRQVGDLERLTARLTANRGGPRDLVALRFALERLPEVGRVLGESDCEALRVRGAGIDACEEVAAFIAAAIEEAPPLSPTEGHFVRRGFDPELDALRELSQGGKEWIANLEAQERKRTGIKSLRVGYNQVFGYYLEVSKANLHLVPADYIRKQTLSHAERFYTPELKEQEARVLGAEERICAREYEIFCQARELVRQHSDRIQRSAALLAQVDVLAGLAQCAVENNYTRPEISDDGEIRVRAGRHPVVERALRDWRFVPNDVHLNNSERQLLIITGPNMAGKSTYLRQVALITLMAHLGSFVPAEAAQIGRVDRIFTRVGAHDDLAFGQSTFMVEMSETANILNHATPQSLVMIDEIGRGTSTYDGLALAWAVAEALHDNLQCKTMFATHFHQLTHLGESLPRAKNLRVAVREDESGIVFLYRIVEGGADRSYGIQVAKLAGLPPEVVERAKRVLWGLEQERPMGDPTAAPPVPPAPVQLRLFEAEETPVLEALRKADVRNMTPLEAINFLSRLKEMLERRA